MRGWPVASGRSAAARRGVAMRGALLLALLLALHQLAPGGAAQLSNIVFVLTDDQDIELGGVTPNVRVRRLIGDQGAVGEAFYVNTPICCPSRTEYLSGRMYHNVLTPDLSGCMHVDDKGVIFNETFGLFPMIQQAGYRTGGFGKIINDHSCVREVVCGRVVRWACETTETCPSSRLNPGRRVFNRNRFSGFETQFLQSSLIDHGIRFLLRNCITADYHLKSIKPQ